jgi:Uma2 family endonuclease
MLARNRDPRERGLGGVESGGAILTAAMTAAEELRMSYSEYLAAEKVAERKHEYLRGAVYAMAGGTPEHAALTAAFSIALGGALKGKPCRVYSSDLRVRVSETDLSTYPDLTVVCGKLETAADDPDAAVNPVVLVEVLSDSTEAYDRGEKAAHYRHIPSLKEYVLVSQRARRIEVFRRNAVGRWELFEYGAAERVELESLGCRLSVDDLYRNPLE